MARCRSTLLVWVLTTVLPASAMAEPPMMRLLRPESRVGLEAQLGVHFLDDLPVYEIDQELDDVTETLSGRVVVRIVNPTGALLSSLPLLLQSNASDADPATDHRDRRV